MDDRLQRVREQIDREVSRRHANRVLHGHPSPLFCSIRTFPSRRSWSTDVPPVLSFRPG